MRTSSPPQPAVGSPNGWTTRAPGPGNGPVHDLGRLLVGLVIATVGGLFLLDAAGLLNAGRVIDRWWPSVIVAAGLLTLAERPRAVVCGTILTAGGAILLLFTTGVLDHTAWKYVWPVAVIAAGVVVIAHWSGRTIPAGTRAEDVIRSTSMFGGAELSSADQAFRGAWLTAIFGGITLDLREARPAADGASVNATVVFGGVDVLVPKGWRISVRSVPIFGGVEDKTARSAEPPLPPDAPTLHVDAVCIFGGVGIKHAKD
ncbi:MAG: LiaF transmembrane domain-containing protein [Solirubrobacteraceae bacterium]